MTVPPIAIGPFPPAAFAVGALDQLPAAVAGTGARRVALVTDRGLTATSIPERIVSLLGRDGITVDVFGDVRPNPTTGDVDAGGAAVRAMGAGGTGAGTAVVSLGGGSALDAAKAIALAAANDLPAAVLASGELTSGELASATRPALPIIAVPTTSGTGAECNAFGVITDTRDHRKCYLGDPTCLARQAILDPALTVTLPPKATAAAGIDCLTHAVESFLAARPNPWADGLDLQVVRLVAGNLRRAVADGGDIEARANLMLAAHTAGQAMSTTGLGIVHGIAHPLGGRFDVPHGQALALVLGECLRFNRAVRTERLARLAHPLGVASSAPATAAPGAAAPDAAAPGARASVARDADAAIAAIEELVADVGLRGTLSEWGIAEADLPLLAADTEADAVMANTPRPAQPADLTAILRTAL